MQVRRWLVGHQRVDVSEKEGILEAALGAQHIRFTGCAAPFRFERFPGQSALLDRVGHLRGAPETQACAAENGLFIDFLAEAFKKPAWKD
jgi:hypothetical protein